MADASELKLDGGGGELVVHHWEAASPSLVVLLVHGYGEHMGRYGHVADALVGIGAAVYGPDHVGHGRSAGERVLIEDVDDLARDLHLVAELARERHPGLPLAVVGHSLGGLIATRFAQLYPDEVAALVLSAPAIGANPAFEALAGMDPMPEVPINPEDLSRDPEVGAAYAADPLVWHGPFKRTTLQALIDSIGAVGDDRSLEGMPVLWMHGGDDPIVPIDGARETVEAIAPLRTERVFAGARHEIFNETNADEVLGELTGFLESSVPQPG